MTGGVYAQNIKLIPKGMTSAVCLRIKMLRALIYVNSETVDVLCMWNQGVTDKKGRHKYLVWLHSEVSTKSEIPTSEKNLALWKQQKEFKVVWHKREDGWSELVIKSLQALKKKPAFIPEFQDTANGDTL
jgi:hypothetical protein